MPYVRNFKKKPAKRIGAATWVFLAICGAVLALAFILWITAEPTVY